VVGLEIEKDYNLQVNAILEILNCIGYHLKLNIEMEYLNVRYKVCMRFAENCYEYYHMLDMIAVIVTVLYIALGVVIKMNVWGVNMMRENDVDTR